MAFCHQSSLVLNMLLCSRHSQKDQTLLKWPPPQCSHPSSSHCLSVILQTKCLFMLIWNKMQHPLVTLWLSNTPESAAALSQAFLYLLVREENVSSQIKVNVIANMAEIPPNVCQCVIWCTEATKQPTFVTLQVCLISVCTTMAMVLWSSLVWLIVGFHCELIGNAEQNTRISVCILYKNVIRVMHQSVWVVVSFSSYLHTQHQRWLLDLQ